jgi:coenzyme F420 hydrogenase subunit beta
MKLEKKTPIERVREGGFCIGCGACSVVVPAIRINANRFGEYEAVLGKATPLELESASRACPFAQASETENSLAESAFPELSASSVRHEEIGYYRSLRAGYSNADRDQGSSGGILTWLLKELLSRNLIDYAICVTPKSTNSERCISYSFSVHRLPGELEQGSTSFYHPVSYDEALTFVRNNPGRYAITGVPCFHKAIRLLKQSDPIFSERIKYQLGLVCGQMKSTHYLEYLLRRAGVEGPVSSALFRRKNLDARADEYFFEARQADEKGAVTTHRIGNREIGVNWGMGLFKPKACDYCDDVFAETADIAVMDGWLPQYVNDGRGTSLLVVRSGEIDAILDDAALKGGVYLEGVTEADMVKSQYAGITHRRKGLTYRLAISRGWVPSKRVVPTSDHPLIFRVEQLLRIALRKISRRAMVSQMEHGRGLRVYSAYMAGPLFAYRLLQKFKRFKSQRN